MSFRIENGELTKYVRDTKETDVIIPDSVTSIGYAAFQDCRNLRSITIPNSVTSIDKEAFARCENLQSVTIPDSVEYIGKGAFKRCHNLQSVTIPDSVTYIGASAFYDCTNLQSVRMSDNINRINDTTFFGCKKLQSVAIPDTVTDIGADAFERCENLKSITIPDSVTYIGARAFDGCTSLQSVTIPDGVKGISSHMFCKCHNLQSVTIPDNITFIDSDAFSGCSNLQSINIPDSVTSIGSDAFSGCSNLQSIKIPDGVTSIEWAAFAHCDNLQSVTIPDSVTYIGASAFEGCKNLQSVTIPDGVTNIGDYAFSECKNMQPVTIPNSVISIGKHTFDNNNDPYYIAGNKTMFNMETENYRNIGEISGFKVGNAYANSKPFDESDPYEGSEISGIYKASSLYYACDTKNIVGDYKGVCLIHDSEGSPEHAVCTFDVEKNHHDSCSYFSYDQCTVTSITECSDSKSAQSLYDKFKKDTIDFSTRPETMIEKIRSAAESGTKLDDVDMASISHNADYLRVVNPKDNIRDEMTKILMSDHAKEGIMTAYKTGITAQVMPEFDRLMECKQNSPYHYDNAGIHTLDAVENIEKDPNLRWAMLLHDMGKPDVKTVNKKGFDTFINHAERSGEIADKIMDRLNFSEKDKKEISDLVREHDLTYTKQSKIDEFAAKHDADYMTKLAKVKDADAKAHNPEYYQGFADVNKEFMDKVAKAQQAQANQEFADGSKAILDRIAKDLQAQPNPAAQKLREKVQELELREKTMRERLESPATTVISPKAQNSTFDINAFRDKISDAMDHKYSVDASPGGKSYIDAKSGKEKTTAPSLKISVDNNTAYHVVLYNDSKTGDMKAVVRDPDKKFMKPADIEKINDETLKKGLSTAIEIGKQERKTVSKDKMMDMVSQSDMTVVSSPESNMELK